MSILSKLKILIYMKVLLFTYFYNINKILYVKIAKTIVRIIIIITYFIILMLLFTYSYYYIYIFFTKIHLTRIQTKTFFTQKSFLNKIFLTLKITYLTLQNTL